MSNNALKPIVSFKISRALLLEIDSYCTFMQIDKDELMRQLLEQHLFDRRKDINNARDQPSSHFT